MASSRRRPRARRLTQSRPPPLGAPKLRDGAHGDDPAVAETIRQGETAQGPVRTREVGRERSLAEPQEGHADLVCPPAEIGKLRQVGPCVPDEGEGEVQCAKMRLKVGRGGEQGLPLRLRRDVPPPERVLADAAPPPETGIPAQSSPRPLGIVAGPQLAGLPADAAPLRRVRRDCRRPTGSSLLRCKNGRRSARSPPTCRPRTPRWRREARPAAGSRCGCGKGRERRPDRCGTPRRAGHPSRAGERGRLEGNPGRR